MFKGEEDNGRIAYFLLHGRLALLKENRGGEIVGLQADCKSRYSELRGLTVFQLKPPRRIYSEYRKSNTYECFFGGGGDCEPWKLGPTMPPLVWFEN